MTLIASAMYFEAFIAPSVAARAPQLFQTYPAGGIPFAVNFLLPRPAALLAVAVFGVGLLGLGHGLRKSVRQPAAQQP